MTRILISFGAAAMLAGAVPAAAETPVTAPSEEARVPFLHLGPARSFRPIDENTLYVRARPRQWYRVTTLGPCRNLPWARAIGVDTRGSPVFDRFSMLIVDGERCPLASVVRSGEPPRRERRPRT